MSQSSPEYIVTLRSSLTFEADQEARVIGRVLVDGFADTPSRHEQIVEFARSFLVTDFDMRLVRPDERPDLEARCQNTRVYFKSGVSAHYMKTIDK